MKKLMLMAALFVAPFFVSAQEAATPVIPATKACTCTADAACAGKCGENCKCDKAACKCADKCAKEGKCADKCKEKCSKEGKKCKGKAKAKKAGKCC